ncbi:unnamed protein product [Pleuronectes platessa]|uniref:Uncharacterized protein n=1 Tax=Pleuronectes platessa TaxID=8262 RepID=A0A9N7TUD2_PLEPL|nr:unnamed protein product [Pleuronectes platessa]
MRKQRKEESKGGEGSKARLIERAGLRKHLPAWRAELLSDPRSHQDPSSATASVVVHHHYMMPTRHRIRHYHYDQPAIYRIRRTGSTIVTYDARSTNRNPWCGHSGPGSAGDKAKGLKGKGSKIAAGELGPHRYPGAMPGLKLMHLGQVVARPALAGTTQTQGLPQNHPLLPKGGQTLNKLG